MLRWVPILVAVSLSAYALSEPRVSIVRPPHFASEGAQVELQVRVTPNAENRLLRVELADELGTVRRSDEQLAGEHAPTTRWLKWILPACEDGCIFVAALYGINGPVARATSQVRVQSVGP